MQNPNAMQPCDTTYEGITIYLFPPVPDKHLLSAKGRDYADAWVRSYVTGAMMIAMPCARIKTRTVCDTANMAMVLVSNDDDTLRSQVNAYASYLFAEARAEWLKHRETLDDDMRREPGDEE